MREGVDGGGGGGDTKVRKGRKDRWVGDKVEGLLRVRMWRDGEAERVRKERVDRCVLWEARRGWMRQGCEKD